MKAAVPATPMIGVTIRKVMVRASMPPARASRESGGAAAFIGRLQLVDRTRVTKRIKRGSRVVPHCQAETGPGDIPTPRRFGNRRPSHCQFGNSSVSCLRYFCTRLICRSRQARTNRLPSPCSPRAFRHCLHPQTGIPKGCERDGYSNPIQAPAGRSRSGNPAAPARSLRPHPKRRMNHETGGSSNGRKGPA